MYVPNNSGTSSQLTRRTIGVCQNLPHVALVCRIIIPTTYSISFATLTQPKGPRNSRITTDTFPKHAAREIVVRPSGENYLDSTSSGWTCAAVRA